MTVIRIVVTLILALCFGMAAAQQYPLRPIRLIVPIPPGGGSPDMDRSRLQDRVDRLKSGAAWAQEPKSRMRRLISNIEIEPPDRDGDITVRSNFVLGELRYGAQTVYFAAQIHRLRLTPEGLKLASKKVILINNDDQIHNLTFLV